jgi:hypothetical protein
MRDEWSNQPLQRTRWGRRGCHRGVLCAGSFGMINTKRAMPAILSSEAAVREF